jgi:PAS domain S-box-containing protein
LEKYTDLYDFAPVGCFSLDERGRILEVNLAGAALLGVERSQLSRRTLQHFVVPEHRTTFLAWLQRLLPGDEELVCEAQFLKAGAAPFWASLHGVSAISAGGLPRWCRVAVSDITALKRAEEAQLRMEALAISNVELRREIERRQEVEVALKKSERHQSRLLAQSRQMQDQLRLLSHQMLEAQEEERKRISRELHDEITQTLVGISVHLENLSREATVNPARLKRRIVQTQRLVERSVRSVRQFARELRPTALDDLGLIATLHSCLKDFMKRTGIRVQFETFAAVEELGSTQRTMLYRVVQSALANVAQHARASRVKVSIEKTADAVHLEVADNGRSFAVDRVTHTRRNRRLGLLGMRERVEMVGGRFAVESAPGRGTTVHAAIPFHNGRRAQALPDLEPD